MANLSLKNVTKIYESRDKDARKRGEGVMAVDNFTMDIADGEFIVLVGPSGCGKSTTLRMIAGLEDISGGEIYIGDKLVNDVEPKDRDIAMVFQNYALYPHMTIYDNIAASLKLRHMPKKEIDEKVRAIAKTLDIEDLLRRKPKQLSGGQRQRVALGRAIVREPKVFLFDEPLSNLDAKLRAKMRVEISDLHQKLGTTFIYVTHDQTEAMTMGSRIVVMKDGVVQQIDEPNALFDYPENKFVAGFIGTPQMNFIDVKFQKEAEDVILHLEGDIKLRYALKDIPKVEEKYLDGNVHELTLGVRAENIIVSDEGIPFKVQIVETLGNEAIAYGSVAGPDGKECPVTLKSYRRLPHKSGDVVQITLEKEKIYLFDKETEKTVTKNRLG